ncbi:DUF5710 domain-containing protein [Bacillus subtilis]
MKPVFKFVSKLFGNSDNYDISRNTDDEGIQSNTIQKQSDHYEGEEWHRYYLNVPYKEREKAKEEGAKWHPLRKQWYTEGYFVDNDDFARWLDYEPSYTKFSPDFNIVKSHRSCWNCYKSTPVYGVMCDEYEYYGDPGDPIQVGSKEIYFSQWYKDDEPAFFPLSHLSNETLNQLSLINHPVIEKCISIAKRKNSQQYCIHCSAKQGNFYLFEEFDSPFRINNAANIDFYKIDDIPLKAF